MAFEREYRQAISVLNYRVGDREKAFERGAKGCIENSISPEAFAAEPACFLHLPGEEANL